MDLLFLLSYFLILVITKKLEVLKTFKAFLIIVFLHKKKLVCVFLNSSNLLIGMFSINDRAYMFVRESQWLCKTVNQKHIQ